MRTVRSNDGHRVPVAVDEVLEGLFRAASELGVLIGVTGGALRNALRGRPATDLVRKCDLDLIVPAEPFLPRDLPREIIAPTDLWYRRHRGGFLSDRQAGLVDYLRRAVPDELLLDPVGEVDADGVFRHAPDLYLSESIFHVALLSDFRLCSPDPRFIADYTSGQITLTDAPRSVCQGLRLIRLETEDAGMRIAEDAAQEMAEYGRLLFRDPEARIRITGRDAERLMEATRHRMKGAADPLPSILCFRGMIRLGAVSFAELREWFGPSEGRELFRSILDNEYHRLEKHLGKIFEHTLDPDRAVARLEEFGWRRMLKAMGYDVAGLAELCRESRKSGSRVGVEEIRARVRSRNLSRGTGSGRAEGRFQKA